MGGVAALIAVPQKTDGAADYPHEQDGERILTENIEPRRVISTRGNGPARSTRGAD